jgi:transposase
MEATGYSRWFERLLAELGFEVWMGDPAEIKAKRVTKQKTDRKDAQLASPGEAVCLAVLGQSLARVASG